MTQQQANQLLSNELNFLVESIGKGCPKKTALGNFMTSLEIHVGFGHAMYATSKLEAAIKGMKKDQITRKNVLEKIKEQAK